MRKRIDLTDGSVVVVQTIGDTVIEVQVVTAHNGSCLLYPQDREEAIRVADALLAAVRAQDEARLTVALRRAHTGGAER